MPEEDEILDWAIQGCQGLEQKTECGENQKQSVFYGEIDQVLGCRDGVTLCHIAQAGSSSGGTSVEEKASNEEDIVAEVWRT